MVKNIPLEIFFHYNRKEQNFMEYVAIGDTYISKLTLGTAQLGLNYGIANINGKPDYPKICEILKAAADHGVNSFDTAPLYGDSEKIIGSFLSSYPHFSEPPIIVTKLPPTNLNGKVTSKKVYNLVREHVAKSAEQLQIKKIPVYLLHRASDIECYDGPGGGLIIESLLRLKEEDFIGVLGVSVYTPEEVEQVLKVKAIKAIQIPINIFDHRLIKTGLLDQLKDESFIVFARSIFLQGLFFLNPENLPLGLELAKKSLKQLRELSCDEGVGIAEMALTFVRDLPGITSLVIGAETLNQFLQNVDLIRSPSLSSELREELMDIFSNLPLELINPSLWKLDR